MRTRNPRSSRAADTVLGRTSPGRAGSRGFTVRDATTVAHPVVDLTILGATLTDNEDGTAVLTVGGTAGASVSMFVDARDHDVALDCKGVKDAAVAAGALTTVTSATAAFVAADTGKTFTLRSATAMTTGTLTFVNATTCTMSVAAGGAITSGWLIYGTDDTTEWQAALNAALPGQTVDASGESWRSLCTGQLNVPNGVKLGFEGRSFDPQTNPAMNTWGPTFVVVQHATNQFIELNTGSGLGDFIFYSANQVRPEHTTATAYAAFVAMQATGEAGCRIGSPYFANAYIGIEINGGRHHVGRPQIGALNRGVIVDHSEDVVDIERITCHPYWRLAEGQAYTPTNNSLDKYALDNAWGLTIRRADGIKVGSVFTFGQYGAVLAIDSADEQGVECGYGMIDQIDADGVAEGIIAYATNTPGLLIGKAIIGANGSGVGTAGQQAIGTNSGGSLAPLLSIGDLSLRGTWANGDIVKTANSTIRVPYYISWTPAVTADTTNPTLGTGSSVAGRYSQVGKRVHAYGEINFGTSGVVAGSGQYEINFPVTARTPIQKVLGTAILYDSSAGTFQHAECYQLDTGEFRLAYTGTALVVTHGAPWTWAASDSIFFELSYEAA